MDLTNLTFYLVVGNTTTQIEEPIGFDDLKLVMKRNTTYHGISAEYSDDTLSFYGNAASVIKTAYEANIDSDITFRVKDGSSTFYEGKLDLGSYQEKEGNYEVVCCKVGEIGVKTTFNSRTESEVDFNGSTTLDGTAIAHTPSWLNLKIPAKTIRYTNKILADSDISVNEATSDTGRYHLPVDKSHHFIGVKLAATTKINEIGDLSMGFTDIADQIDSGDDLSSFTIGDYYQPIYDRNCTDEEFAEKYGYNSKYNLTADITLEMTLSGYGQASSKLFPYYEPNHYYNGEYSAKLVLLAGGTFGSPTILASSAAQTITNANADSTFSLHMTASLSNLTNSILYVGVLIENLTTRESGTSLPPIRVNRNYKADVTIKSLANNVLTMVLSTKKNDVVKADMMFVHEAVNKVVEMISDNQLSVKSSYYGRVDSAVNALSSGYGGGSLKAITNGYRLRKADVTGRQMPVTFKDMIESLNAIDCIGWGFTTENGTTYVRIERWDWFYQNTSVLTITNPNSKTKVLDTDRIITELTIGYKKYISNDTINSVEALHSEHTYNNRCTAITKSKSVKCSWIADVYAIEETRRKQLANDTSEFKYDENIFVFELGIPNTAIISNPYVIPTNYITNATGLTSASEYYNMRITPKRNALRWQSFLRWINQTKEYIFSTGKLNTTASFSNTPPVNHQFDTLHWLDSHISNAENGELKSLQCPAIMKKELVSISYPLTPSQYQSLRSNPYGLINVDGADYWLQEASYKVKTGLCEMKLIPKIV